MKPLFKVFMPPGIIGEVENILYSGNLTSGKNVSLFEQSLTDFVGGNKVIAVNSYNSAASIVWEIIDIKEGDEVIASPMSCLASNQPVAVKRATMRWTDIDPVVGSLDPECVRKNITPKTKAILHYHWGGYPGYIDEINAIGKEYGIPVVEDAIETFGSEYKGKKVGNTGSDFTLFSFQPVRLPTSIDGGGLICKDEKNYERALLLRDYGIKRSEFRDKEGEISANWNIITPAFGAALNELNAFVGLKSMDSVAENLEKQRSNAINNALVLSEIDGAVPVGLASTLPNYWIFSFLHKERDELLKRFREKGLYASKVHIRNDYYSVFGKFADELKGVRQFNDETLSIPSGWWV